MAKTGWDLFAAERMCIFKGNEARFVVFASSRLEYRPLLSETDIAPHRIVSEKAYTHKTYWRSEPHIPTYAGLIFISLSLHLGSGTSSSSLKSRMP